MPFYIENGHKVAVIEGDCTTTKDADRIAAVGVEVLQINTGNACHLDANLVYKALLVSDYAKFDYIFVENVGNLVCPAEFEIGENSKIAVISTTEGDEKPLKYPLLFHEADLVILTKTDLLSDKDLEIIKKWSDSPGEIYEAIQFEDPSVYREISESISRLIEDFGGIIHLIPTSHNNFFGIDDIYTNIQLQFGAGEDILKD